MIFMSNLALAESEKLRDKLSKGTITLTSEVKGCDADAKQYCPGLDPNSQKAFMCMMAYEDKLSQSCKLGILEAAMSIKMGVAAIDYSVRACEADADNYCLDVQPGDGRIVSCLKKNEAKVSKACITALKDTGLWNIDAK
jgi:hypothetical protein